ncbi:hypothetical protein F5Y18DRAFT_82819 [Xylariaceae sp. FL1019]|nr:hypothetical protein F5Y18DRAFT_82819 [Xylariaceae sp. FL1019]
MADHTSPSLSSPSKQEEAEKLLQKELATLLTRYKRCKLTPRARKHDHVKPLSSDEWSVVFQWKQILHVYTSSAHILEDPFPQWIDKQLRSTPELFDDLLAIVYHQDRVIICPRTEEMLSQFAKASARSFWHPFMYFETVILTSLSLREIFNPSYIRIPDIQSLKFFQQVYAEAANRRGVRISQVRREHIIIPDIEPAVRATERYRFWFSEATQAKREVPAKNSSLGNGTAQPTVNDLGHKLGDSESDDEYAPSDSDASSENETDVRGHCYMPHSDNNVHNTDSESPGRESVGEHIAKTRSEEDEAATDEVMGAVARVEQSFQGLNELVRFKKDATAQENVLVTTLETKKRARAKAWESFAHWVAGVDAKAKIPYDEIVDRIEALRGSEHGIDEAEKLLQERRAKRRRVEERLEPYKELLCQVTKEVEE